MESGKKLQWVNSNTFINGTDTNITIDGDNSINLDAASSISLTSTNINVTGNLNVSNGIDLTGNLIATGSVDLANNLIMDSNKKIYWNDGGTYISGNTTSMLLMETILLQWKLQHPLV